MTPEIGAVDRISPEIGAEGFISARVGLDLLKIVPRHGDHGQFLYVRAV